MFDFSQLLIGTALAQVAAPEPSLPGGSGTSVYMNFIPLVLIFGVFYMLIIRPQQKKLDEQTKMIKALRRGDRVITTGGIHGKISKLEGEDIVMLEVADGIIIKILRSHVNALAAKTDPATSSNDSHEEQKKN